MALVLVALAGAARGAEDGPIRARLVVPPGPYLVGQAIRAQVVAVAGGERPAITWPESPDVEITPAGTAARPIATSGIGTVVDRTVQYRYAFWIVARHAGPCTVPSATLRLGDRSGSTGRLRWEVRPLPGAGRTSAFLGGVGPLEVVAEAGPRRLRVGEQLEFRIDLGGPGALGSFRPPDLGRIAQQGVRIEPLPASRSGRPPGRTFRWRLRPNEAGRIRLGPIAIAAFDPTTRRYLTRSTSSIPIEVLDVPRFDPSALRYVAVGPSGDGPPWLAAALAALAALVVVLAFGFWAWRRRTRRPADPKARARRLAGRFERPSEGPAAVAAAEITDALAAYLHASSGRPPGALTPTEARQCLEGEHPALSERAARLVAACDRARFADHGEAADVPALRQEALAVFRALAGP